MSGAATETHVYDGDGNRVKGTVAGVTTVYIAGLYEYQNGAITKYYEGGAIRRTGYASDNGVFYALQDHLHSTSVLVNQNGTVNGRNYYYPYGGNRNGAFNSLTTKRFTGQYQESSLPGGEGLYFYNARWYDARLARFISADTIVPNPGDPQTFNRYAYAGGNPLRFIDPTGHSVDCGLADASCRLGGGGGSSGGGGNPVQPSGTDARNVTPYVVAEANYLAELPEGQMIFDGLYSDPSSPAPFLALYVFYQLVRDGAPLDVKDKMELQLGQTVYLGNQWFEWSTPGNILYGYYGTTWGISPVLLHAGAGVAQVGDWLKDPTTPLGPWWLAFDTPDDFIAIEFGRRLQHQAYAPDRSVTEEELTALLANYEFLGWMKLRPAPTAGMSNPNWPYWPGYFYNAKNPPTPSEWFPSFRK